MNEVSRKASRGKSLPPSRPLTESRDLRQQLPPALQPLTALPNWVVWKWELNEQGKWTKPPYVARNPSRYAKNNDPKTWSTFEQALKAVEAGKADGVGFCLLDTDIAAFDIDDCRDPINGKIDPIAQDLIDRAGSYVEVTPSGTGLRVIGTGSDRLVHTKKNKVNGSDVSIEAYRNCERYITISGMQLAGAPQRLNDIDALVDDVVTELGGPVVHDNVMEHGTAVRESNQHTDNVSTLKPEHGTADNDNFAGLWAIEYAMPDGLLKLLRDGPPPDSNRSDEFYHAVKWMKDAKNEFGSKRNKDRSALKLETIINLLKKYPDGVAKKYNGRIAKEAARAYGKPDAEKPAKVDTQEDAGTRDAKAKTKLIETSEEFTRDFVPPDYLLDGVVLRGFMYAFTAPTGHGKTAVMLSATAAIALGRDFAGLEVSKGKVLYLAGENPDDVRMRWIAMAEHKDFDSDTIDVHFIGGSFDIAEMEKRITKEVLALGGVTLVVIDTGPAFFQGDNENDNVDMISHAKMMRRLKYLPGHPTVLAAMHPIKSATKDNLLPRGGGAFLNEIDGNLTGWREDMLVTVHWQGKHRGVNFEPMVFELQPVVARKLIDSKGRHIPTVIANDLSKEDQRARVSNQRSEEDEILMLLKGRKHPTSFSRIAEELVWTTRDHKPDKSKVQRMLQPLKESKLVETDRDGVVLSKKGDVAADRATERLQMRVEGKSK